MSGDRGVSWGQVRSSKVISSGRSPGLMVATAQARPQTGTSSVKGSAPVSLTHKTMCIIWSEASVYARNDAGDGPILARISSDEFVMDCAVASTLCGGWVPSSSEIAACRPDNQSEAKSSASLWRKGDVWHPVSRSSPVVARTAWGRPRGRLWPQVVGFLTAVLRWRPPGGTRA